MGRNAGYRKKSLVQIDQSDIKAMVRGELKLLKQLLKAAILKTNLSITVEDIIVRIDNALDPKNSTYKKVPLISGTFLLVLFF